MSRQTGITGPLKIMRGKHDEGREPRKGRIDKTGDEEFSIYFYRG